ncbi:GNAT family N-acetyltransferase [Neptunicella marina]|uniref:GNAT family N-acetyltransferase n=1 Tax=Neptunicella marina TaxID=2125989 RepID=A0A8J6J1C1_9ALTE|nr:GNAT family N-acetyltransferase [Neptunicella marina]MBC3767922.1 GNAT family N-acetyltransferase [Neptunicella marina]
MPIQVIQADYLNPKHQQDLGTMLSAYAQDPMGGGCSLPKEISDSIALKLANVPTAFSLLCYDDEKPIALANCFEVFSTFKGKPIINIHDFAVITDYRGRRISQLLLAEIERRAKLKGCCKITLEVLEGNKAAQQAYFKFGFAGYELDPAAGKALFWEKPL